MKFLFSFLWLSLTTTTIGLPPFLALAFVPTSRTSLRTVRVHASSSPRHTFINGATATSSSTTTTTTTAAATTGTSSDAIPVDTILSDLKELLEHLRDAAGGRKLLQASSPAWRHAICQAVGAPDTANEALVADALQQAMARPHNQFAILMGSDDEEDFTAVFPSDPVVDEDARTVWVECQLRETQSDELLVTMGVSLLQDNADDGKWKIDDLQWQDFRDAYYPGLSGREWLRAF